jgi:hypothetical protein
MKLEPRSGDSLALHEMATAIPRSRSLAGLRLEAQKSFYDALKQAWKA